MLESSLTGAAFCLFMNSITLCKGRNAGSFLRWQSCIGLPSRAKLALRRAAMEQHYHSYARTPFASSRRSPRWEASHVIFGSLLLSNKSRSLATSRGNEKFRKAFLLSADRPRMTVGRQHKNTDTNPCQSVLRASGEALIQSLSAFILEILCNARNGMTRIASYLRNPMTKQYIKFLIKADSVNESVLPRNQAPTLSIQESPAATLNLGSTASFAESNFIWIFVQCCVISLLK